MKFYTWKDVERYFLLHRASWESAIAAVDVYPTDITVYAKPDACDQVEEILRAMFRSNYDVSEHKIKLDIGDRELPVEIQEDDGGSKGGKILPLFSNVLYHSSSYPEQTPVNLSHPVIAFHSYKGGVGRTLSLLAFAKAWSDVMENRSPNRLLIVDADIEAPGMTWLQQDTMKDTFSYLDLLTLIQDNRDIDEIVNLACSKLKRSTITIETTSRKISSSPPIAMRNSWLICTPLRRASQTARVKNICLLKSSQGSVCRWVYAPLWWISVPESVNIRLHFCWIPG